MSKTYELKYSNGSGHDTTIDFFTNLEEAIDAAQNYLKVSVEDEPQLLKWCKGNETPENKIWVASYDFDGYIPFYSFTPAIISYCFVIIASEVTK